MVSMDQGMIERGGNAKLLIIMVGLPARGKSYITKKICRYLEWLQYDTKVFNAGNKLRLLQQYSTASTSHASEFDMAKETAHHSASFFDPSNEEGNKLREQAALEVLDDALEYLQNGIGCVAMFNATNSTIARRELTISIIQARALHLPFMFVESQCFDQQVLEANMRMKLSGQDFVNQDQLVAFEYFKQRVLMYEKAFELLESGKNSMITRTAKYLT